MHLAHGTFPARFHQALASGKSAIVDVGADPEDSDSERTRPWRAY